MTCLKQLAQSLGNDYYNLCVNFLVLFMVLVSRIVLFLIPVFVISFVLHDYAIYSSSDYDQLDGQAYR